ncbi:protein belonging to Uncharacterized protein family UPF0153 [mine drainage metagenome]|uniref:Protein belonging to Uncharacterized protein family UPF0153 n=1 Tax=mine drainage metagenome TaxID=410659 RepID=T1BUB6_9ZZZZ
MSSIQGLFPPGTDLSLVEGIPFRCRPGCGLCCYATPGVGPEELPGLIKAAPRLPMLGAPSNHLRIRSRPGGGACCALSTTRCTVYPSRPSPCRTFPIHTHLGVRPQLSLVLSCPGVPLTGILGKAGDLPRTEEPEGLATELSAVASTLRSTPTEALLRQTAHRLEALIRSSVRQGRWEEREPLQRDLGSSLPLPQPGDFPPSGVPGMDEPLENLPLFFEEGKGVLGLRQGNSGYQVLQFSEEGGEEDRLGEFPVPTYPPVLDEEARGLLDGYLRYLLRRDQFWFLAYGTLRDERDRTLREIVVSTLRQAGAHVVVRAKVRASLKGRAQEVLGAPALEEGIRAFDADLLDQPTFGTAF